MLWRTTAVPEVGTLALFLHQSAIGELLRLTLRAPQVSCPTGTAGKVSMGSQDLFLMLP